MRIAYPMRVDSFDKPGGDLLQIKKYIHSGRMMQGTVASLFTGEVITNLEEDFSRFDLVHLTNIDRPVEAYRYFLSARKAGKPIVLSSIHHSYEEIERYEQQGRKGAIGLLSRWLSFQQVEYLRSLIRSVSRRQLLLPTLKAIFRGLQNAQTEVLQGVDRIIVLTDKEQSDILRDFGNFSEKSFLLLRNGFEGQPLDVVDSGDLERDIDICVVGRIEARKNPIAILQALDKLGVAGVFVGQENPNHRAYCRKFRKMIEASRSKYLGGLPHEEIVKIMRRSRVHVSASWFEVASVVDVEAYCAGCKVVSSKCGGTHEILGAYAQYVDPGSPQEIKKAIAIALEEKEDAPKKNENRPLGETWKEVGLKLASLYHTLLEDRGEKALNCNSLMPHRNKVCVQVRPNYDSKLGGDIALAKAFSERLRRFGFEVEILSTAKQVQRFQPRLLIAFNLDQPLELLDMCHAAKKCGARIAIYTLHHPWKGVHAYLKSGLPGVRGWVARCVGEDPAKYLLAMALFRNCRRGDLLTLKYLLHGWKGVIGTLAPLIDELLVSGPSELAAIKADFTGLCNASVRIVSHPIDLPAIDIPELNPYAASRWGRHFFVAGRIESRKNQNAVLRIAAQVPDSEFVFAGNPNESDPRYFAEFRRLLAAAPNCRWLGQLTMPELMQHIACADAIVSPSWFEVMSLINLYAYALGTPIICGQYTYDTDLLPDGVIRYDLEDPGALVEALVLLPARPGVDPIAAVTSNRIKEFSALTWAGFDDFALCMRERLLAKF